MKLELIKESFQSNNLNTLFRGLTKSEKDLMMKDLTYISKMYDKDISSFNDTEVEIVDDIESLDFENKLVFNTRTKKWYRNYKRCLYVSDKSRYERTKSLTIEEFFKLPDGTIVLADLRQNDNSGPERFWVGVKYADRHDGNVYIIQNEKEGSKAYSLFSDTIFNYSWVVKRRDFLGKGGVWLAKPNDANTTTNVLSGFPLGEVGEENERFYITSYLKRDIVDYKKNDRFLVFHLDRMESTGLSNRVSQRGQYDKTTDSEKSVINVMRYTRQILNKHNKDTSFVMKYLLGREFKMFYICMNPGSYYLNFAPDDEGRLVDFQREYEEILAKIDEIKNNPIISPRIDKIMEVNRIVSDKINTLDLEDKIDHLVFKLYVKAVHRICSSLLEPISDKDFKKRYNSAKNTLK